MPTNPLKLWFGKFLDSDFESFFTVILNFLFFYLESKGIILESFSKRFWTYFGLSQINEKCQKEWDSNPHYLILLTIAKSMQTSISQNSHRSSHNFIPNPKLYQMEGDTITNAYCWFWRPFHINTFLYNLEPNCKNHLTWYIPNALPYIRSESWRSHFERVKDTKFWST